MQFIFTKQESHLKITVSLTGEFPNHCLLIQIVSKEAHRHEELEYLFTLLKSRLKKTQGDEEVSRRTKLSDTRLSAPIARTVSPMRS